MKSFKQHLLNEIGDTPAGIKALISYYNKRDPQVTRAQKLVKDRIKNIVRLRNDWRETGNEKSRQRALGLVDTTEIDNRRVKKHILGMIRASKIIDKYNTKKFKGR